MHELIQLVIYLGNTACMDQPDILNGQGIMGSNQLFNTTTISSSFSSGRNATVTPSSNSTVSSTASANASSTIGAQTTHSTSGTAASNVKDTETDGSSAGLSRGAAAGIGIVLGIIGIAAIVFFALMARRRLVMKQSGGAGIGPGPAAGDRPWKRMRDSPEMRHSMAPPPLPPIADRGATPPAAGVFVPPVPRDARIPRTPRTPKTSKSFRSLRSLKSLKLTPRTYYAANPKSSSDVTALPQRGWD